MSGSFAILAAIRRASWDHLSPQAVLLPRAYFVQQEIFQHVSSLAAGERLTTEATGYLAPNGLWPSWSLDNVVKRLAVRTVEERPIVHSHTPTRFRFRMAARNGCFRSSGVTFGAPIVICLALYWPHVQPPNQGIVAEGEASFDAAR